MNIFLKIYLVIIVTTPLIGITMVSTELIPWSKQEKIQKWMQFGWLVLFISGVVAWIFFS